MPRRHAGDVAFLFRSLTDLGPYEPALAAEGLDYHVVGGSAFYAQQEVHDLINVLSVDRGPARRRRAGRGACASPFFGAQRRRPVLARRRAAAATWPTGCERPEPDRRALRRRTAPRAGRARGAARRAGGPRRTACRSPRWSTGSSTSRVTRRRLLGEFLGDRKRANARKLVRLARRFDAAGRASRSADFVARLRADLREPPREEQAATTDEEGTSVRLMSIHQAKGLEFPIVVVPDLNRKPRPRPRRRRLPPRARPARPRRGSRRPGRRRGDEPRRLGAVARLGRLPRHVERTGGRGGGASASSTWRRPGPATP